MLNMTTHLPNRTHPRSTFIDLPNDLVAHRFQVSGTDLYCYSLYRKVEHPWPEYSSVLGQHDIYPGCWLADITTQRLPPEIAALPFERERMQLVTAFRVGLEETAEGIIRRAFSDDFKEEESTSC